jgi:aryl-alcohol dehydrogenase
VPVTTVGAIAAGPTEPFEYRDVTVDDPRDDEILVRLSATGICHTDLFFKSVIPAEVGPCLLGHEGAGVVTAVGAGIVDVRPGEHVVLSYRSCGGCIFCRDGHPAYCAQTVALNALGHRADGTPRLHSGGKPLLGNYFGQSSFAGYALAGRDNTVVVDKDVDLAVVAALGCGFQTGAGAVLNVLRPDPDSRLVIYGAGSVGFAALLAARTLEVETIVAVDPLAARRTQAEAFGAIAVDPTAEDADAQISSATSGGATHAVDTTAIPAVIAKATAALATRGELVILGLGASDVTINIQDMLLKGKTLRGCIEGDSTVQSFIPELVGLYTSGRFPIDRLVTRYPHEDINAAIADQKSGTVIKPVLTWPTQNRPLPGN